jgi:UDP-N-acetylglucosamine--N-acetylmuramyl-(pentapeptide) pyrophosphoryl-undecaprenol N-acetylglucosamine transferase
MFSAPHIVLAGEGGHSHLLSGLALADAITECLPSTAITFVGSGRPIERYSVRERGYGYIAIPAQPPPQGPIEAVRFIAENFVGYWASRWILREQQVSLVLGLGGFAGGLMARAAIARGLPTLLLEQNAVPSRITRWLARSASAVCTTFKETAALLPASARVHVTGFPVPAGIAKLADTPPGVRLATGARLRRLLVLGGSARAVALNRDVPAALGRVGQRLEAWHIVHQTGAGQLQAVEERYQSAGLDALVVSFIDELAHVLAETDLVICRAGGAMLAELAVAGVPGLLIPNPEASDDHQLANAQVYVAAGACRLVDERSCGDRLEGALAAQIGLLVSDHQGRGEMAGAMRNFARPQAAEDIARLCAEFLASGTESAAA